MTRPDRRLKDGRISVYRHPAAVRLAHWINVVAFLVMLTSGLQIFIAHPALYLGDDSTFDRPLFSMTAEATPDNRLVGYTTILGKRFETTGTFGVIEQAGYPTERALPTWMTLPPFRDLATGRVWHFFFAWVLAINGAFYLAYNLAGGRVGRELWPTRAQLRAVGRSIADHARLRFPRGEAARRYNVLQKLSYLAAVFVLGPLMILTGMAMSPGLNAALPWLPEVFGGRQSARTIHFLVAMSLVLFTVVHLLMVLAAGPLNELRSMITGRYVIDPARGRETQA
jgi:thiosulfate reductase cytochrome b subunit